jgi:ATP-binding cassette subfamily B protein
LRIYRRFRNNEFFKLFQMIKPKSRSYFTGLLVFTFTEVSFYISSPLAMKYMIDAAINKDMPLLWNGIFLMLTVSLCGGILFVNFMYLYIISVARITAGIRTQVFSHTLHLPVQYFEQKHSGEILSRMTNDVNTMENAYDWPLWTALVTLIAGTGSAVVMLILDWRVSLFLILTSILFTIINSKFAAVIGKISGEIQKNLGKLTESIGNVLSGFPVIKIFYLEQRMQGQFEIYNQAILVQSKARVNQSAWLDSYNFLVSWVNFGGILAVGAILAGKRLVEFGTIIALVNLLWHVNKMIREFGGYIAQFQGYLAGTRRVIELKEEAEEPAQSRIMPGQSRGEMIEMRAVSFSYDGKRKVLDGFNLSVKEYQTVALVGPSGGGKSTVFKLLLGFYPPMEGDVKINGKGMEYLSINGLREMIAYVPQDAFMFEGTIAENIAYGRPDANMTDIVLAAKAAHAHEFIQNTEQGYDTPVGEHGTKLSGGQRQRIAIARAFLKDAPILLLDEATSSLDSQNEQLIQEALRELGSNKTVIIIAHRLSTIEGADVIFVMDGGKVIDKGKHEKLLANEGLYQKLYDAQFEKIAF